MARFILVSSLLTVALYISGGRWLEFINLPSLLITVGGTLTVTLFSSSWTQVRELGRALNSHFTEKQEKQPDQIETLKRLSQLYRLKGPRGLEDLETSITDPFLRRGISMVADLRKEDDVREQLENVALGLFNHQEAARQILLTAGKLLPAFGLIGTLVGLVFVLRHIPDHDPDALTSALSLAILSTLYGSLLAKIVVLPLAAKLQSAGLEKERMMRLTLEGVLLLVRGETPNTLEHKLGTLLPSVWYEQSMAINRESSLLSS